MAGRGGGSGDAALGIAPIQARNETRGTVLADRVEIGSSLWAKFMGLMGRSSLAPGAALWLPGDNGIHMFFMRFPIDVIFTDREARVTRTVAGLRPWRVVWWARGARDCLELPVGALTASGTQAGDQLAVEPTG